VRRTIEFNDSFNQHGLEASNDILNMNGVDGSGFAYVRYSVDVHIRV